MTRLQRIERKIARLFEQLEKLEAKRDSLFPHREPDTFSKLMSQIHKVQIEGKIFEVPLSNGEPIDIEIIRGGKKL